MIVVEDASTCMYCKKEDSEIYCHHCDRALCEECFAGLQCEEGKCSPKPDGKGVR